MLRISAMVHSTPSLNDDAAQQLEFREELAMANLLRMKWLLILSTMLSFGFVVYNIFSVKSVVFGLWQSLDIGGSVIFLILIALGLKHRLPPNIRWWLGPAYFAFWLILMDGYYFNALPQYGETPTYALGVVAPAILITLPPRWFLGLLIPNHLIFCLILFTSERWIHDYPIETIFGSLLNGSLGVIVAILAAWYRFSGTKKIFAKERQILAHNREMQIAESNVRAILENIPFEAWLKDTNGVFRTVNHAFAKAKGLTEAEIIGKKTTDIYPLPQATRYLVEDENILRTQTKMYFEEHAIKKGVQRWYEIIKSPVIGNSGICLGTVGLARDITERKVMADQLIAADNAKSEFLATMSHEIRTPMNSVLGYTELLQQLSLTPLQREYVDSINNSGRLLLTIINDILDFSKIEAGKIALQEKAVSLEDLFHRILTMFEPQAQEKKIELKLAMDPEIPREVCLDPYRVEQLLLNLLSNALKFTDRGFIEVRVSATRPDPLPMEASWHLGIEVQDTGIGIAPDQMSRLFQPFSQLESNVARRFSGTGLGLVIVERLCKAMGGTIHVESELGKGSTFRATLTVLALQKESPSISQPVSAPADVDELAGCRVLVVEDNATNRRLVAAILAGWGIHAHLSESGMEALEKVRQSEYDVILMDVQMPGMDGLETTRRIRDWHHWNPGHPRPLIIALTAFAQTDDSARCLNAGMDDYLSKPLNTAALKRLLGDFIRRPNKL